ncbi:MAG: M42 family metallopeptidase [Firmicutes bacterium]|jgi:putative aminopeptidase FrvX|nr:M42 family metallopeptidase [Bacillota bacterium]
MQDVIKQLVELYGPTGREDEVAEYITEVMRPLVDQVYADTMGNLIAIKRGPADAKKIMLAAHMDEIGVIITDIDEHGFLRFSNVGGVSAFTLIGQRVRFADGTIGVFGQEKLDEIKDLKYSKMFIDIGATSREEAEARINIGDVAVYHREYTLQGQRVIAKSLDDRIGCAVLIETARRLKESPHEVYFVFTTQEEVGLRGARTAAYSVDPDYGIAVDVTDTGDTPEAHRMAVSLGKGAAIKVKDSSVITHPAVKDLLVNTAKAQGIAYQMEVLERGGTDAGSIHLSRSGVPTGAVSIPARYIHSPSEMVDLGDVDDCVKLLVAVLEAPLI